MPDAVELERVLREQQGLLERLEGLLERELQALTAGESDRLPALADEKTSLCAQLEALEQERQRASEGVVDERHAQVRALTQRVAQANQRNGAVVSTLMRNAQGALAILRGIPQGSGGSVYGPRGQTAAGSSSTKPLASA